MTLPTTRRLQPLLARHAPALEPLRDASVVVTGATGFFGIWVLSAFDLLNEAGLGIRVHFVSRDETRFRQQWPSLATQPWLSGSRWNHDGPDIRSLDIPAGTTPTHVLHMAASSDARVYAQDPAAASNAMLQTTNACIRLCRSTGAHLHFVSSGAVYGARVLSDGACAEDQVGRSAPDPANRLHAYGNAKRMCESLIACALDDFCISRPFAFLGPLLPLDQHFAAGNFIADALANRAIVVKGDGTPLRSYMHPADLTLALLMLLARPAAARAVNLGSDEPVSIAALAHRISRIAGSPGPDVRGAANPQVSPPAYWPDISHAKSLGLAPSLSLEDCIRDTLEWARSASPAPISA